MTFLTDSEDAAEEFVRDYLSEAVDRAPEIDGCEGFSFDLNEQQTSNGGSVRITVFGDADSFLREEEPTWDEYKQAGTIQDWNIDQITHEQFTEIFGKKGGEQTMQLLPLAERMATLVYEEFDKLEDLPATYDTESGAGWWIVPHHIAFASLDYSAPEEIEMHTAGIEEDLKLIAESKGEAAVDSQLDSLLADLEAMREEVKAGRTRFQE